MAYREVAMWEILNVLRRVGRGENKSSVARATGHSRSTIRRYANAAKELGWKPGTAPTEELAAEIARRLSPAGDREAGEAEALLLPYCEQIRTWLKPEARAKRGLRLTEVHQLLTRQGVHVPYSSLHRFAVKHCEFSDRRRVTVRVADCEPGDVAESDFGRLGLVWDAASGRRRMAWALVVVLCYSRHQYVHITFSQALTNVIAGLEDAWVFFGGVSHRLVIDNLAAAVARADRYDPIFQRVFDEYATYRGFTIDAAPVRQPTGKGLFSYCTLCAT